jgi:hypothetical protein
MESSMNMELAALRHMTPAELRAKYLEVYGEPSRTGNKEFLRKRIAWRIQARAEGSLSERARQRAMELAKDADIRTTMPCPRKPVGDGERHVMAVPQSRDPRLPMPGAVLTREYKGRTIQVTVLSNGFDYDGQVYRSLSAVAKAVTGSHWNGHLFFNLTTKANEP